MFPVKVGIKLPQWIWRGDWSLKIQVSMADKLRVDSGW